MQEKKILFLDRDGVINRDVAYLYEISKLIWMPTIVEGLDYAQKEGFEIVVVTNQSGIARGYYQENDVHLLHKYMQEVLQEQGISILHFYYCPHHPEGIVKEYQMDCECRKPKPGLIEQACREYAINRQESVLIGDRMRDVESAKAAGIRGVLFEEEKETIADCIRRAIKGDAARGT